MPGPVQDGTDAAGSPAFSEPSPAHPSLGALLSFLSRGPPLPLCFPKLCCCVLASNLPARSSQSLLRGPSSATKPTGPATSGAAFSSWLALLAQKSPTLAASRKGLEEPLRPRSSAENISPLPLHLLPSAAAQMGPARHLLSTLPFWAAAPGSQRALLGGGCVTVAESQLL